MQIKQISSGKEDGNLSQRVYISADYSIYNGDRDVIDVLHSWGKDKYHKVNYIDTAQVVSGSISDDRDCRACDLKAEFNRQINVSSAVIFIIGDKTKARTAGSSCRRISDGEYCSCTPYKQNKNGSSICKVHGPTFTPGPDDDFGYINSYSYLRHEFEQAKKRGKNIIVVYNALIKQPGWLPSYMKGYENQAQPFWIRNSWDGRSGNYNFIKRALGYE